MSKALEVTKLATAMLGMLLALYKVQNEREILLQRRSCRVND